MVAWSSTLLAYMRRASALLKSTPAAYHRAAAASIPAQSALTASYASTGTSPLLLLLRHAGSPSTTSRTWMTSSCCSMIATTTAAFGAPAGAATRAAKYSVGAPRRRHGVRSYAVSGASYPPGEMHPFGDLVVSGVEKTQDGSASADMLVVSLCEGDAAALAASGDALFEAFGEGLGAVVYELMQVQA